MPAITTEGAALIAAGLTVAIPIAKFIEAKVRSRAEASKLDSLERKVGAALGRLDTLIAKIEPTADAVHELLRLERAESTARAVDASEHRAHFELTQEIYRGLKNK